MNNIPTTTKYLLYANTAVFVLQLVLETQGIDLADRLGLHFALAENFNALQLLTYMFLHADMTHIFFNMFALWMFGRIIEQALGSKHFLIYYLVCGVGAGICQELVQFGEYFINDLHQYKSVNTGASIITMEQFLASWTTIGASGAVYGILLAFGFLFPNERIMLLIPPIPMKAKYFVIGYAVLELFLSFSSNTNVAHFAHLGGMIFGFILLVRWTRLSHGTGWWGKLKNHFANKKKAPQQPFTSYTYTSTSTATPPPTDNAEAKREEARKKVDALLDKIKVAGYESLTAEEKEFLFNISNASSKKTEE